MKLVLTHADERLVFTLGKEACTMLMRRDYSALANRFGYALAFDREHAAAIETDFLEAAAASFNAMSGKHPAIVVKYFRPNSTGPFAVVECTVPVAEGSAVLMELIVSGQGDEKHITLEDISSANG